MLGEASRSTGLPEGLLQGAVPSGCSGASFYWPAVGFDVPSLHSRPSVIKEAAGRGRFGDLQFWDVTFKCFPFGVREMLDMSGTTVWEHGN